jgi:hypothetical protein
MYPKREEQVRGSFNANENHYRLDIERIPLADHHFKPGNKMSPGRPKDTLSKRSLKFADAIMESGVDLVAELIGALNNAKEMYAKTNDPALKATFNAQITNNAEKMLPYMYPKLSSIEVKPNDPLQGMTPEQRLEAMKQAVLMLEREVANSSEVGVTNEERQIRIDNSTEKLPG